MKTKGVVVYVLRAPAFDEWRTDSKTQSDHVERFVLIDDRFPEEAEPSPEQPALRLIERIILGKPYFHAEPIDKPEKGHYTPSGNYVTGQDSKFNQVNEYPIPVFDRIEIPL